MRALLFAVLTTLAAGAAAVTLTACPGPTFIVQQYGGPVRPQDTIAILRVNGGDDVRLLFLDGEDVAAPIVSDGRLHIEMLPGRHTVTAKNGDDRGAPSGSLAFLAEAGKVYRIVFAGDAPRMFEVGRASDRPERDVTLVEAPPQPARPPPAPPPPPASSDPEDAGIEEDASLSP